MERNTFLNGLSATNIRAALLENNESYLSEYLPKYVFNKREKLRQIMQKVEQSPESDFSMT